MMEQYSTYDKDGEYIRVYPVEEICKSLVQMEKDLKNQNVRLIIENEKLKEEHYKDKLVTKLKNKIDELVADNKRGFSITEKEEESIKSWIEKHEREKHGVKEGQTRKSGCIGGTYRYEFIPTSIGCIGTVKCSCGEEFIFSDI